jgi:alkanesulfonate monooxygenase SsuD/methylene tetrahydromethanopterin reductase-like flavin-dependent oxidoreductase (luciferase family)
MSGGAPERDAEPDTASRDRVGHWATDTVPVMRFGLHVPQLGVLGEANALVDLALRAETAGWDGFFVWDHLMHAGDLPACDPWVTLGAIAVSTEHLQIGPLVTPLPRRRPWKVAREAATLDRLAGGRTVLGVGIGTDHYREFTAFGEPATTDPARAVLLDEGLDIVTALWTGKRVTYTGSHLTVSDVLQIPTPFQQPRVPIWCAAVWPHRVPLRRAARWDGVVPVGRVGVADITDLRREVEDHRTVDTPFEVALPTSAATSGAIADYEAAGVTWWLVSLDSRAELAALQAQVDRGPPRG